MELPSAKVGRILTKYVERIADALGSRETGANGAAGYERYLLERGLELPEDFREVLIQHDGGIVNLPGCYLQIWTTKELETLNNAYHVEEFAPGVVLFGSNGGDTAYGFRREGVQTAIIALPFIGMDLREASTLGTSLEEALSKIFYNA